MADRPSSAPLTFGAFAASIAADPRFAPAAAGVCRAMLGFYAEQPLAMRLLGDQGQMRVLVACHYLDPNISTAAVQRLVPPTIASAGRVAAAIRLLEGRRALEGIPGPDRRARHLRLTADARALVEALVTRMVEQGSPFASTPVDHGRCRAWSGEFLLGTLAGGGSVRAGPIVERALQRRGGALLGLELMRRGLEADLSPFSRKGFAQRFGLPRTQVIDLIEELAARGWIAPDGPFRPSAQAMAGGRAWLSRFLAIGASVLDSRFGQLVANGRAEAQARAVAASPLAAGAGGANMAFLKGRP